MSANALEGCHLRLSLHNRYGKYMNHSTRGGNLACGYCCRTTATTTTFAGNFLLSQSFLSARAIRVVWLYLLPTPSSRSIFCLGERYPSPLKKLRRWTTPHPPSSPPPVYLFVHICLWTWQCTSHFDVLHNNYESEQNIMIRWQRGPYRLLILKQ